jgi:hemerythrin superfamily protein
MQQNIFQLLKEDHRQLKDRISTLLKNNSGINRDQEFQNLKVRLLSHLFVEEEVIYERFLSEIPDSPMFLEAKEEHHLLELLISELDEKTVPQPEWMAKLKLLYENLKHHFRKEELTIFPVAKEKISDESAIEMAAYMKEKKEALELEWLGDLESEIIAS